MINIEDTPIIAAARHGNDFLEAVKSPCEIIFWLSPNIMTIKSDLLKAKKLSPPFWGTAFSY